MDTDMLETAKANGEAFTGTVRLIHAVGMHARPAVKLTKLAKRFAAHVVIRVEGAADWINAKSVAKGGTGVYDRIAQHMVARKWGATMVLTEPDAGSDVGAGRTKAFLQADGSWHLEGVKRFITSAEHDMSENIIHLVLARPVGVEGVGGPGTKGLSLFVVPKYHFDLETGELTGERNGVYATNVEKQMGMSIIAAKDGTDVIVTIDVPAVNDEPTFTKGADIEVAEDSGAHSTANWATAISSITPQR